MGKWVVKWTVEICFDLFSFYQFPGFPSVSGHDISLGNNRVKMYKRSILDEEQFIYIFSRR